MFDYNLATEITRSTEKSAVVLQKYAEFLSSDKIFIRQSASTLVATLGAKGCCGEYSLFSVKCDPSHINLCYLLGLLNSKLLTYFALRMEIILEKKGTQPQIRKAGIERLPVAIVPLADQEKLAKLVREVIAAKKRDPKADTTAWEREIDQLVYKLYELTPEEIAIVEESTRRAK